MEKEVKLATEMTDGQIADSMKFFEAVLKILKGIKADNRYEIESGAEMFMARVGEMPISETERVIAMYLIRCAEEFTEE